MFDLVRIVALVVAGSACVRRGDRLGILLIVAITLVDAPAMVFPILHRTAAPPSLFFGFVLLIWGPSGMPMPTTRWTALNVVGEYPTVRTALTSSLALFAMSRAYRRSRPLRPETLEARSWDAIGLRFLFVGLVDALLVVVGLLLRYLDA
jgi:hypothetical protein